MQTLTKLSHPGIPTKPHSSGPQAFQNRGQPMHSPTRGLPEYSLPPGRTTPSRRQGWDLVSLDGHTLCFPVHSALGSQNQVLGLGASGRKVQEAFTLSLLDMHPHNADSQAASSVPPCVPPLPVLFLPSFGGKGEYLFKTAMC